MSLYVFSSIAIKYDPNPPEISNSKQKQSINHFSRSSNKNSQPIKSDSRSNHSSLLSSNKLIVKSLRESVTAKGEAVAGDDASLNNGVLLLGERLNLKSELRHQTGPRFDEEEAEQTSGDVQRRDDTYSEVQLVSDDAEQRPQQGAHGQSADRYLLLPLRYVLVLNRRRRGLI